MVMLIDCSVASSLHFHHHSSALSNDL
jgi:hypothetical protein